MKVYMERLEENSMPPIHRTRRRNDDSGDIRPYISKVDGSVDTDGRPSFYRRIA